MPNQITLLARMKDKPEMRKTPNDISTTTFSVACEQNRNNKATDWYDIVCWRKTAEYAANFGDKGRTVYITGTLQTRSYKAKDGANRKVYEVIADNIVFTDTQKSLVREEAIIRNNNIDTEEDLPW